jgi:hypothetical protein
VTTKWLGGSTSDLKMQLFQAKVPNMIHPRACFGLLKVAIYIILLVQYNTCLFMDSCTCVSTLCYANHLERQNAMLAVWVSRSNVIRQPN